METALKKMITVALLLPSLAFAGSNQSNEDCAIKRHYLSELSGISRMLCSKAIDSYTAGRQTAQNVDTICSSTENVAWRRDQDNSMSDSDDKPARAMAVILSQGGTSMAVQVCPGVYLATAHGALDNPNTAREQNRPLRDPHTNVSVMSAFPLSKENKMKADTSVAIISPRLRDPSSWDSLGGSGAKETDYAFITVDKIVRPDDYVTPLNYESNELLEASSNRTLHVELTRPSVGYQTDSTGHPVESVNRQGNLVFDDETLASGSELLEVYKTPQRVGRRCDLSGTTSNGARMVDNCPTETGVSGSPYSTKIGDRDYLLGIQVSSQGNINVPVGDSFDGSSAFVMTKEFCEDFKTACGKPCPSLSDALSQQSDISI
jgi:hypothetical protein